MDIMKMMKQVQKLQTDMAKLQEELAGRIYDGASGGGAVKATVNGKFEVLSIEISPDAVDPSDVEMLQDLVVAAVNDALRRAREDATAQMSKLTGGMTLPGLM
ncbi:MAG: YbaB/EbfC family nucleoid-associated protein [Bacillota bacterium]